MSDQMTLPGIPAPTSSPVSPVGTSPCGGQDGPKTGQCGPDHVPVSRFRARDSEKAMPTNDTSGPLFTRSSISAGLQRCLENRLRARTEGNGSPLYELTWKHWDMPAGVPICRLLAQERPTDALEFGGWPTR